MKFFNALFIALLSTLAPPVLAEQFMVVGIMDGDTVKVLSSDHRQAKCRLHGIDAPEKSQSNGQKSKQALSDLIYRKAVDIQVVDQDRYGRSVCRISLGGRDINLEQVSTGMAWMYRQYNKDPMYDQAESSARSKHIGLWAEANPTPPWEFRRSEKGTARDGAPGESRMADRQRDAQGLKSLTAMVRDLFH